MTRIEITNRNQDTNGNQDTTRQAQNLDTLGALAGETAGFAGSDVSGGEMTSPQSADEAVEKHIASRDEEQQMFRRQMQGEVGMQNHDLKPSPAHPSDGMPENTTESENSGGSSASVAENEDVTATGAGAQNGGGQNVASDVSAGSVARAVDEGDDRFLRAVAELENFKRQSARRETETRDRAVRQVIEDLLPVMDNFERALDAARNARDVDSVRVGVEFIAQQLRDALKNHGVEPIQAQGLKFDPLHHEALEEVADSGQPEGTVVDEAQRGYSFKGQVLRPSLVRVAG